MEKFGLNYRSANDFCFKFLKPVKSSLDKYSTMSFNYNYKSDNISIFPYSTSSIQVTDLTNNREHLYITYRINYFKKRYRLKEQEIHHFAYQYRNIPQTRELIEKSYRHFISKNRMWKRRSSDIKGAMFLKEIQQIIDRTIQGIPE